MAAVMDFIYAAAFIFEGIGIKSRLLRQFPGERTPQEMGRKERFQKKYKKS